MKYRIAAFAVLAFFASLSPSLAQWQTPNHSVPVGRGAGVTGFGSAGPGTAGMPLVSGGASADPSFTPLNLGGAGVTGPIPNSYIVGLPNSSLANMPAKTMKGNNATSAGAPLDLTVVQTKSLLSIPISVTDPSYGAKGDCVTDDTAAFQAAWNAAAGAGAGKIHVPATGGCYLVTKINGTNSNNVIVEGDGDQSLIKLNGFDAVGNWWDLSGSNNIQFRDLKFVDNGSPVRIAFLWACTGVSCGTSGVLSGLSFDHVNANFKHSLAGLYAYGYGCAANCSSGLFGGSLSMSNLTWKNTYNGPVSIAQARNALLDLTAYNIGAVTSVYVTVSSTTAIAARTHLYNVDLIDLANGTSLSNNASMVLDGVNQMITTGGSYQCLCEADVILWTSVEGLTMNQPAFQAPIGTADPCMVFYWIEAGGGVNAAVSLETPFFSCPRHAVIAFDQGVGATNGGGWFWWIRGTDVGLNNYFSPMLGKTLAGCGSFAPANNWFLEMDVQFIAGADGIDTCGSIDNATIFQKPGTITLPGGATDSSFKIPGGALANPTAVVGLSAVNGAASTGMRSDAAPALSQAIVPTWTGTHTFAKGIINTGTISSAAWLTSGILYQGNSPLLTDTTSSGTVAAARNMSFGGGQISATNPTTYTNYFNGYFNQPSASTNVTFTNSWGVGADSAKFGTTGTWAFSTAGAAAATTTSSSALTIGPNGATNPVLQVDASTASQAAGWKMTGAATAGTVTLIATDSGANTNASFSAKGAGATSVGAVSSGGVSLAAGGGSTTIAGLTDISGASAGQIKFPATQNASADANTLDDYKEIPAFTPTVTFGGNSVGMTFTSRTGYLTKIGNVVHYMVEITMSAKGSSTGTLAIGLASNAPVSVASNTPAAVQVNNLAASAITTIQAQQVASSTSITLSRYAAGANVALTDAELLNNSVLKVSGIYFTP